MSATWAVETLGPAVDRELEALPADMRARFVRVAGLIEEFGPDGVRAPHVRHLTGPLWEMRMNGRTGISRALYVVGRGRKVVVVRVFVKKTQKTPSREIDIALKRAKEAPR